VVTGPTTGDRRVDPVADLVVGVDDEQGEQVIAAPDVAVDRRRHDAEVARHRAQGQRRRADAGELLAAEPEDVVEGLLMGALPGSGHGPIVDTSEISVNFCVRCSF